jgi:DNA-binding HxlR family transcriptional regulator
MAEKGPVEHRHGFLDEKCASRQAVELIGNKWTILVLFALAGGTRRYREMQRMIVGVSQKMLTQTLHTLEQSGLVHREVYPVIPPKVEYSLTPLGQTLLDPILAIKQWSDTHMQEVLAARERLNGER